MEQGITVIEAPMFRTCANGIDYPARNELGTLKIAAEVVPRHIDSFLFCEADMLFTTAPVYGGSLAGEYYSYLDYSEPRIVEVAATWGVRDLTEQMNRTKQIGVPYWIPTALAPKLASRWIEVLDSFGQPEWIDIMYAFGIALTADDHEIEMTHKMTDNSRSNKPLATGLIHYCYGDSIWDKRFYREERTPFDVPQPPRGIPGTVGGEILAQISEAKCFYDWERRCELHGAHRPTVHPELITESTRFY
jgi:hypothetical protein